ncbi:diguanylate phosphodiesterase [Aliivibrio sp. 1S165]|uniref:bifunctional diguanylate cyclase/phosphodiesterase n=1 Tax=unclassified Aliivibrio TaxID=2645654 RepID=UPI00080E7152|nr:MULTISPECIES: EAL domain-containing protein [unclassified Aliivibrio]OCH12005.1 diguanylate phosphodiesterase [Aliivibrio sp. 1S165]OCH35931.1 diguanylate phosphodiesterase [Aliivibrio sp. 1S175]
MQTLSFSVQGLTQLKEKCDSLSIELGTACLIQLFSSQQPDVVDDYYAYLQHFLPNSEVIGLSVIHSSIDASIFTDSTVISISILNVTQLTSASVFHSQDEHRVGHHLLKRLSIGSTTKAIIAFGCHGSASNYRLFDAFSEHENQVPVSGGVAADTGKGTWVFLNGQFYSDQIVAVAMHGEQLQAWSEAFVEWNPIGKRFRITSSEGNVVKTIDNIPAYEFYCRYLSDTKAIPLSQIQAFPLMLEEDTVRYINAVEEITVEGYLKFALRIPTGREVRLCYYHPSLTQEQVNQGAMMLAKKQPESIFIYNCESRIESSSESTELQTFSDIGSCQGIYGMGEFFRSHKQVILHHSLTYLALRESVPETVNSLYSHSPREHNLTPLFSLIKNSIQDVDQMTLAMEKKISDQSLRLMHTYRTDRRTGLFNRIVLKERLESVTRMEHLLSFKLTNLSQVNEKYGYQVGDKLLQDVSHYLGTYLADAVHTPVELYSIGIAEWGVVFDSDTNSEVLRKYITDFIEKIEHFSFEPYGLSDVDYLSVSISGGLISRRDFINIAVEELILKAVEARRIAMRRNRHLCNARDLLKEERLRQSQLDWLTSVNRAITQEGVLVYGQPILKAGTRELVSTECLMRIYDNGQVFAPGQFLPAVEGTHLYTRLSREMITRTFDIMQSNDMDFSINLSPQDLMSDRTLDLLESSIMRLDNPFRVGFEVLETEQIQDYDRMIEVCNHFKRLGARIIIDDFGSGYSNIDEIMKLEPQVIKLDGSIIKNVHQDKRQRLISQQMVQLCHALEAKVVAEFVHNKEVCSIVEDMGVDYLQGYYLGEPKALG